jgi:hypothetical protein
MTNHAARPNVAESLAALKGFQRTTVDYAFERLYGPNSTRRFLVADEVGLGKTLVARGVIARAVDHLWDTVDRIDVIYICSNGDIARQNINRLRIGHGQGFELASRVTLLPTVIKDLEGSKLNFISFTPGTSFDLKSSLGQQDERLLLYHLLDQAWGLRGTGPMNLLQGGVRDADTFRDRIRRYDVSKIDQALSAAFAETLETLRLREQAEGGAGIRDRFGALSLRFGYARQNVPEDDRRDRAALIGELRGILAQTCLRALQPDLVILDEFQRFKSLLDGNDEAATLAKALFSYTDDRTATRVLLLSATPYKMFTLHHEQEEDDHHADFLRTVEFLDPDAARDGSLRDLLRDYRRELYHLPEQGHERLLALKSDIESRLRRTMCRTERLGLAGSSDGMLREVPVPEVRLDVRDVRAFRSLQRTANALECPQVVEYWKSAPYLLNFMDDYELKRRFRDAVEVPRKAAPLVDDLAESANLLIPWERVAGYEAIDLANARLRGVLEPLLAHEAWRLLWMPPSLPYYRLHGSFAASHAAGFTKRLVFSTWAVVPRALSALASYEVERRIFSALEQGALNTPEWRSRRRGLLRFAMAEGRFAGMPVLTLLYPSFALATLVDPRNADERGGDATAEAVLGSAAERLGPSIRRIVGDQPRSGDTDEAWYWAAPLLLDLDQDATAARAWLDRSDLPRCWTGAEEGDADEEADSRWADHVNHARQVRDLAKTFGPPPTDLAEVLALIAIGSPAVTALRALLRPEPALSVTKGLPIRDAAAQIAWSFRTMLNQPESSAIVRTGYPDQPFWRASLRYAVGGCLQSVLDEYCHVLRDGLGLFDRPVSDAAAGIAQAIGDAVTIRTSSMRIDDVRVDATERTLEIRDASLRSHFAMRFGTESSDEGKQALREDQVRTAFNSPFRPFILASTSVGQEGLDFHPYCHAVVHWNLPSNPVDLEQREGRVHRYKGHAVRKNIATAYGREALTNATGDPWEYAFERARTGCADAEHGLVPYWVFQIPGGAAVERHVPRLPLSVDGMRLDSLKRSLAVYRMVFGQPRQDDLLTYLLERVDPDRLRALLPLLQVDLSPPNGSQGRHPMTSSATST